MGKVDEDFAYTWFRRFDCFDLRANVAWIVIDKSLLVARNFDLRHIEKVL